MFKRPPIDGTKISRRSLLKRGAAAGLGASLPLFNINHAWSQDVYYDGEVFDAGGATLNVAEWGGFWQEFVTANLLDQAGL